MDIKKGFQLKHLISWHIIRWGQSFNKNSLGFCFVVSNTPVDTVLKLHFDIVFSLGFKVYFYALLDRCKTLFKIVLSNLSSAANFHGFLGSYVHVNTVY